MRSGFKGFVVRISEGDDTVPTIRGRSLNGGSDGFIVLATLYA
jgi:hypothetical protein